ncbi:MAG: hypothetical protein IKD18_05525, partial [Clostridia bacterium]|nr:hypothetical protein [Clostridia bacterium]
MANVLIEFYSDRTPENLISILNESYDSVIFLYAAERSAPSPRKKAALSELVKKLFGFPAEFLEIPSLSVAGALEALNSLWKKGNLY